MQAGKIFGPERLVIKSVVTDTTGRQILSFASSNEVAMTKSIKKDVLCKNKNTCLLLKENLFFDSCKRKDRENVVCSFDLC